MFSIPGAPVSEPPSWRPIPGEVISRNGVQFIFVPTEEENWAWLFSVDGAYLRRHHTMMSDIPHHTPCNFKMPLEHIKLLTSSADLEGENVEFTFRGIKVIVKGSYYHRATNVGMVEHVYNPGDLKCVNIMYSSKGSVKTWIDLDVRGNRKPADFPFTAHNRFAWLLRLAAQQAAYKEWRDVLPIDYVGLPEIEPWPEIVWEKVFDETQPSNDMRLSSEERRRRLEEMQRAVYTMPLNVPMSSGILTSL